jgi:plastocyanin
MLVQASVLRRQTSVGQRALLAAALAAALIATARIAPVQAASTLNVSVGAGTGTTTANAYMPGDVTILVGDSVKFTIDSDEPHSVTFGNGPAGTSPDEWPVTGLTGTVPPPPATANLTGTYGGTGFLNTGVIFRGSTATIQFTAAGSLPYICVIHPGMAGVVKVVASGTTTSQADADAKAAQTRTALLGAEASLAASVQAQVSETKRSNGTSLWSIYANAKQDVAPQPGGGTGYLELLRFIPSTLEIEAGDSVKWTATSAHTVTFPASGQDPATIDPFTTPPTTNSVYDGQSFYHSALFGFPAPGVPTTYTLTFPDAGTFNYVCALHGQLGQTGQIVVAAAPTVTTPPTDVGADVRQPTGSTPWWAIALLSALATSIALAARAARRR